MMKYVLVVLAPTGEEKRFEAQMPFMAITQGDTLNMALFRDADNLNMPLQVVNIEHMVSEEEDTGQVTHMVAVYTERCGLE